MVFFSFPPSIFLLFFFFLLISAVPSVYPRNVTLWLNDTMLVVKWKPPPLDKINGILRGYLVTVRHGTQTRKVRRIDNTIITASYV